MIRFFDLFFSLVGLIVLFPLFIVIAVCIVLDSRGGVFFRQVRVGKNGNDFRLYKFRSMAKGADRKGLITVGENDSRVTRVGRFLRKYKLDELPQLLNVFCGDMSLVGPRPEVRKYVDLYTREQRKVLSVLPGITDYASIEYIDENRILGQASNPDKAYVELIMPDKIRYNMKYIDRRSVKEYFKIIFLTCIKIIR
ncbi:MULTISPECIES: sugar transferase [Porphyromonadaceae]|uniref:Glycosyl transferase n=1 Tax=Sanguibacteroides justesenii TaxID=1547597 RepID=A0A0C3R8G0_9PORP|nr:MULTISPECIES: sugar transferase [Porphyromonadaceae]KIO46700.1 glycosyl transferase [Sanguibacteroides justesenii]KIO46913.1 glycosyl transferase [Sanguibacteroides justesenii]